MILAKDFYTATCTNPLTGNGTLFAKYSVKSVVNVRNLKTVRSYFVTCTLRLTYPNAQPYGTPGPTTVTGKSGTQIGYFDYPAFLSCVTSLGVSAAGGTPDNVAYRLVEYTPRTINSSVNVSANMGINNSSGSSSNSGSSTSTGQSTSLSHTSGSSNTNTNSYSASATVGFPWSASATASYSHESSHTTDQSSTSGSGSSSDHSINSSHGSNTDQGSTSSSGDSMTVKDWTSYVQMDPNNQSPKWIWSQEYPWDITRYGLTNSEGSVSLPDFVLNQLFTFDYDSSGGTTKVTDITAPSALALTTIDFVMSCVWQIDIEPDSDKFTDFFLTPSHTLSVMTGSHGINGKVLPTSSDTHFVEIASGYSGNVTGPTLDLTLLGLDPVIHNQGNNGAVIGFVPNRFIACVADNKQDSGRTYFKILSAANNLQVTGSGFDLPSSNVTPGSNRPLCASVTGGTTPTTAQLNIFFKMTESSYPLSLFLKHWIGTPGADCQVDFYFNPPGYTPCNSGSAAIGTLPDTPDLTRHVNTSEGAGADNNLTVIDLRNTSYSSADYHDYLVPGLNLIVVQISTGSTSPIDYTLRAAALGS